MTPSFRFLPAFFCISTMIQAGACGSSHTDKTNGDPTSEPVSSSFHPIDSRQSHTASQKSPVLTGVAPEGMALVPGGTFRTGHVDPPADGDEGPVHEVTLKAFYLDITEVTNLAWATCVTAGECRRPKNMTPEKYGFKTLSTFQTDDRPVTGVSQSDAEGYCRWRGMRLPTEAEFERAARGDDARLFPWGNDPPDSTRAVYGQKVTEPVGSKPAGAGPYGHMDLAGNVWEWSADRYDPMAYQRPSASLGIPADCTEILTTQDRLRRENRQGFTGANPIPTECEFALRGGAFNYHAAGLRASNRVHHPGSWRMIMAGFRCAGDI